MLDISDSPAALGAVIAARQVAAAGITVLAGVWADRLPRHLVLVAAAVVQAITQATSGALVLTGEATVPALAALALVFGLADGFVIPASQGLIPTIVASARLQQANALLGLTRSVVGVAGPALGGVMVAVGSPGGALLADAGSFAAAALLLVRLRMPAAAAAAAARPFFHELREGWTEFRRHTWLWTTIVFFGIGNFAGASYFVLGPLIAKQSLGGVAAWATIVSAFGVGTIIGGLIALRIRPRRPLLASCLAAIPYGIPMLAIALELSSSDPGRRLDHRRGWNRHSPRPLVHGLPAARAGGRPVTSQLLRRARILRPAAARFGSGRTGRIADRHPRDADRSQRDLPGMHRHRDRAAERVGDPRRAG